jgi:hypothetical protein
MSRREMIHEACRLVREGMYKDRIAISCVSKFEYRQVIAIVIKHLFVN